MNTGGQIRIFVTAGTQLPFDRLLKAVDEWAGQNPHVKVTAQAAKDEYNCRHIDTVVFLSPIEYEKLILESDVIVAHAGMGTILTALEKSIPIILLPRRYDLLEHRNNHQASTAKKFMGYQGVYVVEDNKALFNLLSNIQSLAKPGTSVNREQQALLSYLVSQFN